jgi:hypothetical protein
MTSALPQMFLVIKDVGLNRFAVASGIVEKKKGGR